MVKQGRVTALIFFFHLVFFNLHIIGGLYFGVIVMDKSLSLL